MSDIWTNPSVSATEVEISDSVHEKKTYLEKKGF